MFTRSLFLFPLTKLKLYANNDITEWLNCNLETDQTLRAARQMYSLKFLFWFSIYEKSTKTIANSFVL